MVKKVLVSTVTFVALIVACFSAFGPWDTYRSYGKGDNLSRTVYIGDFPVWFGNMMGWETQSDSDAKYLAHLNTRIQYLERQRRQQPTQNVEVAIERYKDERNRLIDRIRRRREQD